MHRAFFIAGTDTDVGKTTIAAGLLHAARLAGLSTAAVKPVASDCKGPSRVYVTATRWPCWPSAALRWTMRRSTRSRSSRPLPRT